MPAMPDMFGAIARFEVRYQLRQPVFAICLAVFALLTFGAVTSDFIKIGGAIGNVERNAPFVIMQILLIMSTLGAFVTTAFVATAVQRDVEHDTQALFFTTRASKRDYLLGRFAGALSVAWLFFAGVALAIVIGSFMPWLEPERVGPFTPWPYLFSLAVLVLPNLFLTGSVFFSVASLTRSLLWTYVSLVGLFVGYAVAAALLSDLENEPLAALLDPFGFAAFSVATKYWTVAEKNTAVLSLDRTLILNRLLWSGLGALVLAFAYRRFRFTLVASRRTRKRRVTVAAEPGATRLALSPARPLPAATPAFGAATTARQFLHACRLETAAMLKGGPFLVLVLLGVLNIVGSSTAIDTIFGTPIWPVTQVMLRVIAGAFVLFLLLVLAFYAGEMAWRDRVLKIDQVIDATPVPTAVLWGSKLVALFAGVAVMLLAAFLTGVAIQTYRGYHHFEPALYAKGLGLISGVAFLQIAVLALFVQALTNHKYLGYLGMVLFYISVPVLDSLDFDHNLYRYAQAGSSPYSDMNGYGHFVAPVAWFYLYWSFAAAGLAVLTHLLWARGHDPGLGGRLARARARLRGRPFRALGLALAGMALTGAWIFYNTNVLNPYRSDDVLDERQARFEKLYKRHEGIPKPRIVAVEASVDIDPERRSLAIRGSYVLRNKTEAPIETLHLWLNPEVEVRALDLPGSRPESADEDLGYSIRRLEPPLAPGDELRLVFDLAVESRGFVNHDSNTKVVGNGTFFNSIDYFPHVGYSRDFELVDPNLRRRHDLPPVQRMRDLDDPAGRRDNYITGEADWVSFETTVSTSPDQIAIAPGYLQKEWQEGGRRNFHYRMDAPILGFWSYLSARYAVKRDRWNDVAIEVYHHPGHAYNVDRMIDAVKKSLEYFTTSFGPYQHRQVRILEFPRYASFAQSFPNTIPFSENIGFIARLDGEDPIDYPFYVTAHEVAHQWWAHQVIGGNVQGATVLSETLSQYSALMVMEHEYGPQMMRRFLKYELDLYLRGRGGELVEELPLMRVENQPYIHYRKGSVVMYALKDVIGETALNAALARYLRAVAFQEPPYTTTRELLAFLRGATPPEHQGLIDDLFETITLHENQAREASYTRLEDGKFAVKLAVLSARYRADGKGVETEVEADAWVDIAVFGARADGAPPEGKLLFLEKHRLSGPTTEIEVVVDELPVKAGVDPFHKLVDRNPENNITRVTGPAG